MEFDFGLRGHDIADNFEDICNIADENHISQLQFALAKTMNDIDFDKLGYDYQLSDMIKNRLKQCNLNVAVLGCYINPVNQDKTILEKDLKRFENFLYYAKDFNANVIGTETGMAGTIEYTRSEENYKQFLRNLIPLVTRAEELNLTIGIEPVLQYTIYSPIIMKRMIDDIKTENLGVILDVSNMMGIENRMEQHRIINQSFELFSDRIKIIHLKDFTFEKGKKKFAIAGTGELDIQYLFRKTEEYNVSCRVILDETKSL